MKASEFENNAISMKKIDGEAYTITKVVDSDYTQDGKDDTPGVRFDTKETFEIDGANYNSFYTTRVGIVRVLRETKVRDGLEKGETFGPVICEIQKGIQGKKDWWGFVDA